MEKFKEKSNIIGISQSCSGGSIRLNSTEKISAEAGERIQNLAEFYDIVFILFIVIIFFVNDCQSNLTNLPYFLVGSR